MPPFATYFGLFGLMICILMLSPLNSNAWFTNSVNVLLSKDPSENLGPFWYHQVEMFYQRVDFFKGAFLVMQIGMCCFMTLLFS